MSARSCRLLVGTLLIAAAGCKTEAKQDPPPEVKAPPPEPLPPGGGMKFRDPPVYADGEPVAALSFGELPPSLETRWVEIGSPKKVRVRRFSIADYVESLGFALRKVKEVHLYGGRSRVSIFKAEDLAKYRSELLFAFEQSTTGPPRLVWPDKPIPLQVRVIDKIFGVAIYLEKKPPVWRKETHALELDGEALDGEIPPYVEQVVRGGTRIYVDGRLAAIIKKNKLPETEGVKTSTTGEKRWSLAEQLAALGVRTSSVKTADLIHLDVQRARIPASALAELDFAVLDKSGGQIALYSSSGAVPARTPVSAILLYEKSPPRVVER